MLWETTFQYYTNGEFQNTRRLADESDSQRSCPEDRSLPRMSHLLQKEPLVFIFGPLAVHVCLQSKSVAEGDVALRKYHCMANVHFVLPASIRTVYHGAPFTLRKTPDGCRAHLQMNLGAPKVQSFSQVHTQSVPRLASPTGLLPTHVFLILLLDCLPCFMYYGVLIIWDFFFFFHTKSGVSHFITPVKLLKFRLQKAT